MMNRFQACRVRFISFLTTILITALPSIHAKANTVNLIFDQSLTESSLFQSPKEGLQNPVSPRLASGVIAGEDSTHGTNQPRL